MHLLQQFKAAGAHSVAGSMIYQGKTIARLRNNMCIPTEDGEALLATLRLPPVVAPAVVVPAAVVPAVVAPPAEPEAPRAPASKKVKIVKRGLPAPTPPANPIDDLDALLG
jgi:hypothetical protein